MSVKPIPTAPAPVMPRNTTATPVNVPTLVDGALLSASVDYNTKRLTGNIGTQADVLSARAKQVALQGSGMSKSKQGT
jgi:hypothetical protein